MHKQHQQHAGELYVQQKRNVPAQVATLLPQIIQSSMPRQHSDFFASLDYLAVGARSREGRLWATILSSVSIVVRDSYTLDVTCVCPSDDPFLEAVTSLPAESYFAGVGVDFSNRRRNKLAGVIESVQFQDGRLELRLRTNENLGNCPKYITVRTLKPLQRTPAKAVQLDALDADALAILRQASTVFLVTQHLDAAEPDLGFNHRGGNPGFVRHYQDRNGISHLVLPDYSGNRFYQSLGNIESDKQAGMVIPDFTTGDLLYVTGTAANLYDSDAESIMPQTSLVSLLTVEAAVLIRNAINLQL
ncbi:hypothetical protein HDU91_001717, partial [Kappamyces sp. JEL0680]